MKTDLEILFDILDKQRTTVIACDIDLTVYNRKALIVKDAKASAFFDQKIHELKAVKERAEETIEVIKKKIAETDKANKNVN